MKQNRPKLGFTLIEMIAVLVVIGILTTVATFATLSGRSNTTTKLAQRTLNQIAVAQEEHFRQRGSWLASTSSSSNLGDVTLTTGDTDSEKIVSYYINNNTSSYSSIGLAIFAGDGICVTLKIKEPGRGEDVAGSFIISESRQCNGEQA